jgi:hypothetical protein
VIHIQADSATRAFMASESLTPEAQVTITAIGSSGARLICTGDGGSINLDAGIANLIRVKKIPGND